MNRDKNKNDLLARDIELGSFIFFQSAFDSYQPHSILFYPITLHGHRGNIDDLSTTPVHLVTFSAALAELTKVGRKTLRN